MRRRNWLNLAIWLGAAIIVAGCSRSEFDSTVSGTVTLDGKPLDLGFVCFSREGGGNPAMGTIQRGGSYILRTSNKTGLNAGKYRVIVSALDTPNPPPGVRDTTPPKQLVPEKYTNADTSRLQFDVAPGSNTFDINLKSK
jgi:hypothetical protein